jgi:hypothetical protein
MKRISGPADRRRVFVNRGQTFHVLLSRAGSAQERQADRANF